MQAYNTIKEKAYDEFTEKRSRFIGYVSPVKTVNEANGFISEIRQKHYDAKHNVFAYILRDGNIKKYSDDGEPQGTAGLPVLDVLEKIGVTDVCVVATRYFGGILLGGGGLVRAYSHTAKIALTAGGIITMTLCNEIKIRSDYTFYGKLNSLIPENGGIIENVDFDDGVTVYFYQPSELFSDLIRVVTEASNGKHIPEKIGEKFVAIENLK